MRVDALLALARARGVARLDAQLLVAHHAGRTRTWVLAHDDSSLPASDAAACADDIERRAEGCPIAYLLGQREFHGLELRVDQRVLIPRPETEVLVDWALELLRHRHTPRVADLGTGSGAIALAIRRAAPHATVTATDRSADALSVASDNGRRLGLEVEWLPGDWWAPLSGRLFELVASNPPYVAGDDTHLDALRHEPRGALTPEGDGLSALTAIVQGAPQHLTPGGWLLLEHGHDQGEPVRQRLAARGFSEVQTRLDLAGIERCTGACWPGPTSG